MTEVIENVSSERIHFRLLVLRLLQVFFRSMMRLARMSLLVYVVYLYQAVQEINGNLLEIQSWTFVL